MELSWRQTQFAWIAARVEHADERGQPVEGRIKSTVQELSIQLLQLGGIRACIPFAEERLCDFVRSQGRLISPRLIQIEPGKRNDCHANCAKIWNSIRGRYQIMTGYGLSDDMWRRHTWLMSNGSEILETTTAREMYFGVILNDKQAESFCRTYGEI